MYGSIFQYQQWALSPDTPSGTLPMASPAPEPLEPAKQLGSFGIAFMSVFSAAVLSVAQATAPLTPALTDEILGSFDSPLATSEVAFDRVSPAPEPLEPSEILGSFDSPFTAPVVAVNRQPESVEPPEWPLPDEQLGSFDAPWFVAVAAVDRWPEVSEPVTCLEPDEILGWFDRPLDIVTGYAGWMQPEPPPACLEPDQWLGEFCTAFAATVPAMDWQPVTWEEFTHAIAAPVLGSWDAPGTMALPTVVFTQYGGLFLYTAANWGSGVSFYFEACMRATVGEVYARLWNYTDGAEAAGSEVVTPSGTFTLARSKALALIDGKMYRAQFGVEPGDAGEFLIARVIAR